MTRFDRKLAILQAAIDGMFAANSVDHNRHSWQDHTYGAFVLAFDQFWVQEFGVEAAEAIMRHHELDSPDARDCWDDAMHALVGLENDSPMKDLNGDLKGRSFAYGIADSVAKNVRNQIVSVHRWDLMDNEELDTNSVY